ncbi:hypothetical protein FQN57_000916 [Myotisia sp. PD_48]|nr:hypothetical protein FQN57_000916 [Myotisia sp. PD_48]
MADQADSTSLNPNPGNAATTAAHLATLPRRAGSKGHSSRRADTLHYAPISKPNLTSSSNNARRSFTSYDLASAGAAAGIAKASQGGYPWQAQQKVSRLDSSTDRQISVEEFQLSAAGSKVAFTSVRDSGVSGLEPLGESTEESLYAAKRGMDFTPDEIFIEDGPEALVAASGAMSTSRKRAESTASAVDDYPDLTPAVSAATKCHRAVRKEEQPLQTLNETIDPGKLHSLAISRSQRDMYTSHPPLPMKAEEQRKQETLQAAAISMAQQLYALTQKAEGELRDTGPSTYTSIPKRTPTSSAPRRSLSATQRHTTMQSTRRMATHPYRITPSTAPRSRSVSEGALSVSSFRRGVPRPTSEYSWVSVSQTGEVGQNTFLMAAAQKNVNVMLENLDQNLTTRRPSSAMMKDWERKANERVRANRAAESRAARRQSLPLPMNVDEVARAKIQPTLDEIDERVNARRAKDVEKRLDTEHEKRTSKLWQDREKDSFRINNKLKKLLVKGAESKKPSKEERKELKQEAKRKAKERKKNERQGKKEAKERRKQAKERKKQAKLEKKKEARERKRLEKENKKNPRQGNPESQRQTARWSSGSGAVEDTPPVTAEEERQLEQQVFHTMFPNAPRSSVSPSRSAATPGEAGNVEQVSGGAVTEELPAANAANTSRQWSTSDESVPPTTIAAPAAPLPGASQGGGGDDDQAQQPSRTRGSSKKRFSFTQMFQRSSKRDGAGTQGSFSVQRRTETAELVESEQRPLSTPTTPVPQASGLSTPRGTSDGGTPERRSRFREEFSDF